MALIEVIADMLDALSGGIIIQNRQLITEIRLRIARAVRISLMDGTELEGAVLKAETLHKLVNRLMDNSLYARENELKRGYFTTSDGYRVGVCGKVNAGGDGVAHLANIGSVCIRIPREVRGCAQGIYDHVSAANRLSVLLVSPPGLGKTTLLRDYVRIASERGLNVALADERREIAACLDGVAQLDVGCRTDVMDGCPKALALSMMIRACAPDLVAVDEIGSCEDAQSLQEAKRCGVSVVATAHGRDVSDVVSREDIGGLIRSGVFDWCVLLGPKRGQILEIKSLHEGADEKVNDDQGNDAGNHTALLHLCGKNAVKYPQAQM